ncbi:MAG: hypothetical protein HFJ51_00990 [Clostridia bacterium]|nr:hypothetical protein [Clostridia bacterium]
MKDKPILKTVKLIKADEDTKELIRADFEFNMYEDPECNKLIEKVMSDKENATITFKDLRYGIYYIRERKST